MVGRATRPAVILALEGPSGAGKSSVGARLGPLLGATLVPEAYDRLGRAFPLTYHGRDELADLERQLLREDGHRWTEAVEIRARGTPVLLDTGTFAPLAYSWGLREGVDGDLDVVLELVRTLRRRVAGGKWGIPDLTVYLDVPEPVARARARLDPMGHPPETADRHAAVGRWERLLYGREFPRALPGRFLSVTGEGSPQQVALVIQDRLERLGPLPPATEREAELLLRLFEGGGAGRSSPPHPNP
jgi:thymidylate kinase